MCMLFPWSRISPNMEGLLTEMRIAMYMCILFPWPPISPTWRVLQREMRIAMSVCVYYSLDHIFPKHGGGCSQKWELQCLYVYIIPLITYFPHHGGGCWDKWELQCLCVYIIPLITYFPNMEGVAHRYENCIVCICILFLWSPISPTWKRFLTEMIIAMSARVYYSIDHLFPHHGRGCAHKWELHCICVYYSFDHLFSHHGGGCWEKWELQCLCVYIIPLITYFPNMEGVGHRNENCIVCICILFLWSPISPTWKGFLTEMRIAMPARVYYSLDHLFPHHGRGCAHRWELQCICVYYSFDHLFSHHGGECWEKCELQFLCVYIIPLITYFPNMEGLAHLNENCNVSMCILFPWSPIFPTWRGLLTEMRIAMSVYEYYSFDHLFFHQGGGCWEKWELQCMYLYIIPLITYFPNMEGVAHRNENCNVCMCILFPWSPIPPNM